METVSNPAWKNKSLPIRLLLTSDPSLRPFSEALKESYEHALARPPLWPLHSLPYHSTHNKRISINKSLGLVDNGPRDIDDIEQSCQASMVVKYKLDTTLA